LGHEVGIVGAVLGAGDVTSLLELLLLCRAKLSPSFFSGCGLAGTAVLG